MNYLQQVIEKESAEVEARSELVRKDEAVANQKASESQALKEECESDLAEAIPALEAALAALNTLKVHFIHLVLLFWIELLELRARHFAAKRKLHLS